MKKFQRVISIIAGFLAVPTLVYALVQADGIIESTSGGFKFPDGTTQTTAASNDWKDYYRLGRPSTLMSPADNSTWYGSTYSDNGTWISTDPSGGVPAAAPVPAGTLNRCRLLTFAGATTSVVGSSEPATFHVDVNGNSVASTSITFDATHIYDLDSLGVSLSAGDLVRYRIAFPAFATNPTLWRVNVDCYLF